MTTHETNGRVKLPYWFVIWLTTICIAGGGAYLDMRERMVRLETHFEDHIKEGAGPRIVWAPKGLLADVAHADTVLVTNVPIIISPKAAPK